MMGSEFIIVDRAYKYEVDEILEGGIGYVRLMSLKELSRKPPTSEIFITSECVGEHSKYPYRNQLAAKTIKNPDWMESFSKECEPWLGLNMQGVVPLLKLIKNGEETLALMPRFVGNLRMLMLSGKHSPTELLKALYPVITSLSNVYTEYGIVHQAIKPNNILYCYQNRKLVFELSDWGIADVQAVLLPDTETERRNALDAFGSIPYLAPERFEHYLSDIRADIFSLGMILFEIITGELPYDSGKSITQQIESGIYYDRANTMLTVPFRQEVVDLLLQMIHPVAKRRLPDYGEVLETLYQSFS